MKWLQIFVILLNIWQSKCQQLTTLQGPWRMVFKVHRNDDMSSYNSAASFLITETGSVSDTVSVKRDLYDTGTRFRSSILEDWGTISAVRMSMWSNDLEKAYFVFSAAGKTKSTWMDCGNLLYSSYTDIFTETIATCKISNSGRNFIIQRGYGGCTSDNGWMVVNDADNVGGCDWDKTTSDVTLLYAPGTTYTTWHASKYYADAFTISVMDWYMVFKGIQGVIPTAGSLQDSWEGDTAENDGVSAARTLTTSPSSHYKNGISEIWTDDFTLIETVKYGMYAKGQETTAVIFKAIGTTKTTWFDKSKILYSDYKDLTTSSPQYCSILGDGTRQFAVTKAHGGCTSDYHWMLVMDVGADSKPCGFDQDVTTRPYFLYSSDTISVAPDLAPDTWNSIGFPTADVMGFFIKGWFPVMKVANGQSIYPASSIYTFWTGSGTSYNINEFEKSAYSIKSGTPSYRSRIVSSWTSYYIRAVRVSFIKSETEAAFAVFDAHASERSDWMSCSNRLLYSSFTDLNRYTSTLHCSITGDGNRRFFAEKSYGGCDSDAGWFVVSDSSGSCDWENTYSSPFVLYSDAGVSGANKYQQLADVFLVSVAFDDFCNLVTCQNGGTCYERGTRFECVCAGDYYNIDCNDLDGGWSDWGSWGSCSSSCHFQGTYSRSRSCNNPSKDGNGLDCTGSSSESATCDPTSEACPSYGSGTVSEGSSYTMACPSTFTIYTQSAYYGRSSSYSDCHDSSSTDRVKSHCDGHESCVVTFSETLFTGYTSINCDDCDYVSSPCSSGNINGYANFKCGRNGGVSTWSPWSLCTVTCDGGTRTRSRTCDNPLPISPGTGCSDTLSDTKDCFTFPCPSCGEHMSGYYLMEPWNMTSYNDSESGVGYLLTNTHYEILCCESIAAIEFFTSHEGSITFSVWRKSGSSYSVLASAAYTVTASEANTTVNYTFSLGTRMIANIGDMIGWYTPGDNMIPYILCTGEENCPNATKKAPLASEPVAASSFAWDTHGSVTTFPDRAYAIKFYTSPNTAPYVNQTDFSTLVKDHEPPGTWAIDYAIFTDEVGDPLTHSMVHAEGFFELNSTYDPQRLFLQVKKKLPKEYNIYSIVLTSKDTCDLTVSTTYSITTYNAPPVYLNLPTSMELKEDMVGEHLLWQIDVMDPSDNDSICCTLAQVSPGTLNFDMRFTNNSFNIFTTPHLVFNYKEISDFYKLRVCCSDDTGTSMSFIDIDIVDVINKEAYIPPAWFFTAVVCSMIPMSVTLFIACGILFATMFLNPELHYIIIYED